MALQSGDSLQLIYKREKRSISIKLAERFLYEEIQMERKAIMQRIADIDGEISIVRNILKTLEMTSFATFPAVYEKLSVGAAIRSERIACKFRHLSCTAKKGKPRL